MPSKYQPHLGSLTPPSGAGRGAGGLRQVLMSLGHWAQEPGYQKSAEPTTDCKGQRRGSHFSHSPYKASGQQQPGVDSEKGHVCLVEGLKKQHKSQLPARRQVGGRSTDAFRRAGSATGQEQKVHRGSQGKARPHGHL